MTRSVVTVCILTGCVVSTSASPAHAQRYIATELSGGGNVVNAVYADPGWFLAPALRVNGVADSAAGR